MQSSKRSGTSRKAIRTNARDLGVNIPRDRDNSSEAVLPSRHSRRFDGLIAMYARGMSTRGTGDYLPEQYGVQVWLGYAELPGDGLQRTEGARSGRHPERRHGRHQGHDASLGDRMPEDGDNAVLLFADLAKHLGAGGAVLPLPVGGTQAHLHDELD